MTDQPRKTLIAERLYLNDLDQQMVLRLYLLDLLGYSAHQVEEFLYGQETGQVLMTGTISDCLRFLDIREEQGSIPRPYRLLADGVEIATARDVQIDRQHDYYYYPADDLYHGVGHYPRAERGPARTLITLKNVRWLGRFESGEQALSVSGPHGGIWTVEGLVTDVQQTYLDDVEIRAIERGDR